jgi:hypothetical protein
VGTINRLYRHELKPLGRQAPTRATSRVPSTMLSLKKAYMQWQTPTRATSRVPSPHPLHTRPYYDYEAAPQGRGVGTLVFALGSLTPHHLQFMSMGHDQSAPTAAPPPVGDTLVNLFMCIIEPLAAPPTTQPSKAHPLISCRPPRHQKHPSSSCILLPRWAALLPGAKENALLCLQPPVTRLSANE